MKTHTLKTDPEVFQAVLSGAKTFEIRRDDRGFCVGDRLNLLETASTGAEMAAGAPLEYTGGQEFVIVTHILRGPIYGLAAGWAVLSIKRDESGDFAVEEARPQEPVHWLDSYGHCYSRYPEHARAIITPLYTHPAPLREPLTPEQVNAVWDEVCHRLTDLRSCTDRRVEYTRAIEAAHGIAASGESRT